MIPHILGFLLGQQGELLRLVENYLDDSSHTWIPPRTAMRTPWTIIRRTPLTIIIMEDSFDYNYVENSFKMTITLLTNYGGLLRLFGRLL